MELGVATLCWDTVATAVGITSCLNIACTMSALNLKKESSEEVKGLVTGVEKCTSSVNRLTPFVADCGALRCFAVLWGASQPVCPK